MVSGPTTSWQTEGEKVEAVTDYIFWGCKITIDGDCTVDGGCMVKDPCSLEGK